MSDENEDSEERERAAEDAAYEATVELGRLAGEEYGKSRLEPQGYRRVPLERWPEASFDLVYAKESGEVTLIDTRAADIELDVAEGPDGITFEQGTRSWVEYILANMRERAPEVAQTIESAFRRGALRYFDVYQAFDENENLGDITIREFKLRTG